MCLCWLRDIDLFLDLELLPKRRSEGSEAGPFTFPLTSVPITVYLGISETRDLVNIPKSMLGPVIEAHNLSYSERVLCWKTHLDSDRSGYEDSILECSRRFRLDEEEIENVCKTLRGLSRPLRPQDFVSSCWIEADLDMGESAQRVNPRFNSEKLILPIRQQVQFQELLNAMRSLTRVHYEWKTGNVWNEAGVSALFAGPSGVGKTMAAEILSRELGLPMFRIDLSQVVNKYIGETEKNLKKLFDKAELCDVLLFFDEADSLFGRRTEINSANDKYANLEVNYLLGRMETYKGLAILATNKLKDIDDAFLRRLRCVIEFPYPTESQRKDIWKQCIPQSVDSSEIDIVFLAKQFQLTGGNIRSVVFNACLQSASSQDTKSGNRDKITMESVIIAIKREYDKLKQSITLEQFGTYRNIIENIDHE
jgi:ATPase family protein associated with various cellular activities (AAA)